jgi:hypothetical protein
MSGIANTSYKLSRVGGHDFIALPIGGSEDHPSGGVLMFGCPLPLYKATKLGDFGAQETARSRTPA